MDLACELNDNDRGRCCPVRCIPLSANRSRQAACGPTSLTLSLGSANLEWGYHGIIRSSPVSMPVALEAIDRAQGVLKDAARMAHRRRCFISGSRTWRGKRLNASSREYIRLGLDHPAPTDEAVVRWVLQAHPISVSRDGKPCATDCVAQASCRGIGKIEREGG